MRDLQADLTELKKCQARCDLNDKFLKESDIMECLRSDIEEIAREFIYGISFVESTIAKEWLERAIKAEAEVEMLKEGLERIKTNIEEYHPHNTLALPKFRFAKEYHDIAIQALKELEVQP